MTKTAGLEALAELIAERVKGGKPARPLLRVITPAKPTLFDTVTRECILKRVRWLAKAFQLQWLIDQAAFNVANLDCLDDKPLSVLLANMERARECLAEGISFEEAGLIQNTANDLPEQD